MIIDGQTVLTGSFNFTKAGKQKNAEHLQIIQDPAFAAHYPQNLQAHAQHSQLLIERRV